MMTLSLQAWHRRFTSQANWTRELRNYLYEQIEITTARRVLEVGSGTGAILADLPGSIPFQAGLDYNRTYIDLAIRNSNQAQFTQGDAHMLPYLNGCFDLTLCHFLLLWVNNPLQVVREMARVTRLGGSVIALAEPDYGGRIDYPSALEQLGYWQSAALQEQGATPLTGRALSHIFHQAGLQSIVVGVLGGQWKGDPDWELWEQEWKVLESDLALVSDISKIKEASKLKALDKSAYQNGERILFVPTFYAWGRTARSAK